MAGWCVESCSDPRLIASVLNRALPAEDIDETRIARQILLDPNFRPDGSLLVTADDEAAGYCWAVKRHTPLENAPDDRDRGYIVLFGIVPEARRKGLGGLLLECAENYLASQGCSSCWISPYAPGYFTPGIDVTAYSTGLAVLKERGYKTESRPLAMELDLANLTVPEHAAKKIAQVEQEMQFSAYTPDLTIPLLHFAAEEFSGDWVRFARDAARAILKGDDPGRLQIANMNDRVMGFSHYEGARFGPIGVSNQVEGKGVGSALMLRTLKSMAAKNDRIWFLWTEDTTAERFYAPWGWKEWRRFEILRKGLT